MSSAIHQEYEEGFDTLGPQGAVFFKFFSLFSAKDGTVKFGPKIIDGHLDPEIVGELRAYLKEQKEWIRTERRPFREMTRRMWWLTQKIVEYGVFSSLEQKHVMLWLDTCLDQIV